VLLNLDGGEHNDEAEELYLLADLVHIACGGHAGDSASIARVTTLCRKHGTRIGAHPSYVDRAGFGRVALELAPAVLEEQIAEQCARVAGATSVKPHGALYHAAHADAEVARALVSAVARSLGRVAIVGLAGGALEAVARESGHEYWREAFADRGVRADGSLVPRGEPGALITDPAAAAARARAIVAAGGIETICCHADTPSSLAIVRAVRSELGPSH
jgi:UPF0271 protein